MVITQTNICRRKHCSSTVSKLKGSLRLLPLRLLTVAIGCIGLFWGAANLRSGMVADSLRELETRLLRFESFDAKLAGRVLEATPEGDVSPCDTHAQHALMLLEIPAANSALQFGDGRVYEKDVDALEARTRQVLGCSPRDSLGWVIAFGLQVQHGELNEQTFQLLAMSYETSPNEAWIAVRRTALAVPVLLTASPRIQEEVLDEFENLVRRGFIEMPARAYAKASPAIRILLDSRVNKLDDASRREFSKAVQSSRS